MSLTQPSLDALSGLPAPARQAIYAAYGVSAVVVSAIQVGFAALPNTDQPTWLTVTLAVVAFLAIPVAALAAVNVGRNAAVEPLDLSEHPDVIAYQTGSGLPVAGEASPIPTGTPVIVASEDPTPEFAADQSELEPSEEYPAWDGKG